MYLYNRANIDMMSKFELFESETTETVLKAFIKLYRIATEKGLGKISDLQKEVMSGVSAGLSYSKLQRQLDKKHIASIQAPLTGGIKNIMDAIVDTVWLYNNQQLLEWLNDNVPRRLGSEEYQS